MPIKKILCAVDDSRITRDVAACAVELAQATGAKLTFLAVDLVSARLRRAYFWDTEVIRPAAVKSHKPLLPAVKAAQAAKFENFECVAASGSNVADAIISYAAKNKADHIVIGTHTTNELARIFVGSVATAVVSHAPVPVTVVK
jgi:nucleotide-binding universal stress UspA family protein